jgi:hypothetical protein
VCVCGADRHTTHSADEANDDPLANTNDRKRRKKKREHVLGDRDFLSSIEIVRVRVVRVRSCFHTAHVVYSHSL